MRAQRPKRVSRARQSSWMFSSGYQGVVLSTCKDKTPLVFLHLFEKVPSTATELLEAEMPLRLVGPCGPLTIFIHPLRPALALKQRMPWWLSLDQAFCTFSRVPCGRWQPAAPVCRWNATCAVFCYLPVGLLA